MAMARQRTVVPRSWHGKQAACHASEGQGFSKTHARPHGRARGGRGGGPACACNVSDILAGCWPDPLPPVLAVFSTPFAGCWRVSSCLRPPAGMPWRVAGKYYSLAGAGWRLGGFWRGFVGAGGCLYCWGWWMSVRAFLLFSVGYVQCCLNGGCCFGGQRVGLPVSGF